MRFQNKTVLVTGGSNSIGKGIVEKFLAEGAEVIVFDINKPESDVTFFEVNITNEEAVAQAFSQIEKLDILVNNAGIYDQAGIESMDSSMVSRMVDINVKGPIWVTKHALPLLKKSKGNIVNIASCLGIITEPGSSVYCATKAAVIMLAKVWSQEYAKDGVRVNAVLPGPIDTPLLRKFLPDDTAIQNHGKHKPLGRIGKPEDVANIVAFLASEDANFVTGATYSVDGGESASSLYTKC